MRRSIVGCCFLTVVFAAACSRQETAWRDANRQDEVAAYEEYLAKFPAGTHAAEARAKLAELRDQEAWTRADRLGTPEAWQRYLGEWPRGRMAATALRRLAEFMPPPAAPAAGDQFMAQLGAFSSEAAAQAALQRILREQPSWLDRVPARVFPPFAGEQPLWRIRAGPLDEAAARELCAKFLAAGMGCLPVARNSDGKPQP